MGSGGRPSRFGDLSVDSLISSQRNVPARADRSLTLGSSSARRIMVCNRAVRSCSIGSFLLGRFWTIIAIAKGMNVLAGRVEKLWFRVPPHGGIKGKTAQTLLAAPSDGRIAFGSVGLRMPQYGGKLSIAHSCDSARGGYRMPRSMHDDLIRQPGGFAYGAPGARQFQLCRLLEHRWKDQRHLEQAWFLQPAAGPRWLQKQRQVGLSPAR